MQNQQEKNNSKSPISDRKLLFGSLILFIVGFLFIRYSILQDSLEISVNDKPETEEVFEIKPTVIFVVIENENGTTTEYRKRLQNTDSVEKLLEILRIEDDFTFEKIAYSYGTEIDNINGVLAPEGYNWRVFKNGEDVTFVIEGLNLEDAQTYYIRLTEE